MTPRALPPFARALLLHGAVGFGIATLFVVAILTTDPFGLATLLRHAEGHPWPVLLLWYVCGLTFGGVQFSIAVMLMEDRSAPQRLSLHDDETRR